MKHIFTFGLLLCYLFGGNQLGAQVCTPDPSFTGNGLSPDSVQNIPQALVGTPYSTTVTFRIPTDTVIMSTPVDIDSVHVDSISGQPTWLSYQCEPNTCTIPGGGTGCAELSGLPDMASLGTHPITVYVTYFVKVFTSPAQQPDTLKDYYKLKVDTVLSGLDPIQDEINFKLLSNPVNEVIMYRTATQFPQQLRLSIVDMTGRVVFNKLIQLSGGISINILSVKDLASGQYVLSLNGQKFRQNQIIQIIR